MLKRTKLLLFAANMVSPIALSSAYGQTTTSPDASILAATTQDAAEGGLSDIIVTAQKRSENLQRVPIAVTAIGGAALKAAAVDTGVGLAKLTPNLTVTAGQGFYAPYLRGVGTSYSNLGLESSVAIYFDDIYVSRPGAGLRDLNDIARIEVLKGPQGTLFGRNAAGGAIRFITNDPVLGKFEGNGSLTYGRFNQFKGEGVVNVPIGAQAALRIAYVHDQRDGFVHNIDPTKPDKEDRNIDVVRAKFRWEPSDAFTVKLSGDYSKKDDMESQSQIALDGAPTQLAVAIGGLKAPGFYETTENYPAGRSGNALTEQYGGQLRLDLDLGHATLSSISGYRGSDFYARGTDLDATNLPFQHDNYREKSDSYSQELQIVSDASSKVKYLAGLYYFREVGGNTFQVFGSSIDGAFGVPSGPDVGQLNGGAQLNGVTRTKIESFAPYAQASYDFSDQFQLLVGARYTFENKRLVKNAPFASGVGPDPIPLTPPLPEQKLKFEKFTPRVTLSYKPVDDVMLYGTYSVGFKSGGINTPTLALADTVKEETLDSYEVGWKTEFGNIRFNGAAFYYDFKDLQVQRVNPATGGLKVENAASARIYGLETDIVWAAAQGLDLGATAGWLDAKYKSYQGDAYVPCATNPGATGCAAQGLLGFGTQSTNFAGDRIPNTSKLSFSVYGQYEHSLGDDNGSLRFNALYSYAGPIVYNPEASLREKARNLVNAGITWISKDERYDVSLFGDNLLNQKYNALQVRQGTGGWRVPAPPLTWGVRVGAKF